MEAIVKILHDVNGSEAVAGLNFNFSHFIWTFYSFLSFLPSFLMLFLYVAALSYR